jgi:Alginate lyase
MRAMLHRRGFCTAAFGLVAATALPRPEPFNVAAFDRKRVLTAAGKFLREQPVTVTASSSIRSAGGKHDFFSEGDYWWPDPNNPGGPYIQRDGMSNPDNFVDHRRYLMRLSVQVPALVAAWTITKEQRFADHAGRHLGAWFVNKDTRMNPNLQYSQAIHGLVTGRGTGIIDTIHLVEVARAIELLPRMNDVRAWFADYLEWMTTHANGIEERDTKNNHATCWVMQAASFARLTGNAEITEFVRDRFKNVLIPGQVALDGSFPEELRRTKPYGYSLFNLDAMAAICQLLSTPQDNLWKFERSDGRGMRKALEFMAPYIRNKSSWPHPADVMYAKEWPMRQCALLFGGLAYDRSDLLGLWKTLPADSAVDEVIRNFFIRQPVLWA